MSKDPFLEMVKKKDEEKKKAFRDALSFAKSEARLRRHLYFVRDCERQFKERGFLTKKQVEALYRIDSWEYEDEDEALLADYERQRYGDRE